MLLGLLLLLGVTGAAQQILLSYSFRYADASLLAPFEYLSLPLALIVGLIFWSEMPDLDLFNRCRNHSGLRHAAGRTGIP